MCCDLTEGSVLSVVNLSNSLSHNTSLNQGGGVIAVGVFGLVLFVCIWVFWLFFLFFSPPLVMFVS